MNQDKEQSKEEQAALALKEIYQAAKNNPSAEIHAEQEQPDAGQVADELKGSDADIDHHNGIDDQIGTKESAAQRKGSDADTSQNP